MNEHDLRSVGPLALIVMGVSGSGKSTLAAALAGAIGCPFLEGDEFHSPQSVRKMQAGIPLTDDDRWPWLDRLAHAIGTAVADHGIAVASCSALKKVYRDRLRRTSTAPVAFVLPDVSREELSRRMTSRPGHFMPASLLTSQLDTLERPRSDELAITIDGSQPPAASCEQIVAWLLHEPRPTARG
jgi:gluconokinase